MPWQNTSGRTSPLPPNWATIRAAILRRDQHQCTEQRGDTGNRCEASATDVDHIGDPADHRPENLRALCAHHHRRKTARQGALAKPTKPKPKHPGYA